MASGAQALPQTGDQSAAQQAAVFGVRHHSFLLKTDLKNQNKSEEPFNILK